MSYRVAFYVESVSEHRQESSLLLWPPEPLALPALVLSNCSWTPSVFHSVTTAARTGRAKTGYRLSSLISPSSCRQKWQGALFRLESFPTGSREGTALRLPTEASCRCSPSDRWVDALPQSWTVGQTPKPLTTSLFGRPRSLVLLRPTTVSAVCGAAAVPCSLRERIQKPTRNPGISQGIIPTVAPFAGLSSASGETTACSVHEHPHALAANVAQLENLLLEFSAAE